MWANKPEMAEKWEDEEDEKNEGKTMRVTTTQLRQIVRESLIQTLMVEQDVTSAIETLIGTLDDKQKEEIIASLAGGEGDTSGAEGTGALDPTSLLDDPKALESAISSNPGMLEDFLGSNSQMIEDLLGGNPEMLQSVVEDPAITDSIVSLFKDNDTLKGMLGSILPGGEGATEGKTMRITRGQLRQIIKEAVSLEKGLYARPSSYGGMFVEDSSGENISMGEMILNLVDAGDTAFFNTDDGEDPESLEIMLGRHAEGVQGGIERWDSDVFETHYSVDNVKLINRYAYQNKLRPVHWLGEDDEMPSDAAWREQNVPPESEYEDDGTNEFEERYS